MPDTTSSSAEQIRAQHLRIVQLKAAQLKADYWFQVRRLTWHCLLAWFCPTFLLIFFARELSTLRLFGWPMSFYMAAQGLIIMYVLIVAYYVIAMREYDKILKGVQADGA